MNSRSVRFPTKHQRNRRESGTKKGVPAGTKDVLELRNAPARFRYVLSPVGKRTGRREHMALHPGFLSPDSRFSSRHWSWIAAGANAYGLTERM